MRCSSTIAAETACLGIMPGVACASYYAPFHDLLDRVSLTVAPNVYATVDSAWTALSASTQGMAARLSRFLDHVGPVYDAAGFGDDSRAQARGVPFEMGNAELGSMPMHAIHPRLSDTPGVFHQLAFDLGRHNDEIMASPSENGLRECIQLFCTDFHGPITADVSS